MIITSVIDKVFLVTNGTVLKISCNQGQPNTKSFHQVALSEIIRYRVWFQLCELAHFDPFNHQKS